MRVECGAVAALFPRAQTARFDFCCCWRWRQRTEHKEGQRGNCLQEENDRWQDDDSLTDANFCLRCKCKTGRVHALFRRVCQTVGEGQRSRWCVLPTATG